MINREMLIVGMAVGLAYAASATAEPGLIRPSDPLDEWPRDPVYVFYPRDTCQGDELALEVWSRRAGDWVAHPVHPRVPIESCQLEDAGVLWNEIRRRCLEEPGDRPPPSWIVGMNVFDSELTSRCAISHGDEQGRMEIEVASPAPGTPVRSAEPVANVQGQVLLDGLHGARYDVIIAIDTAKGDDGDDRLVRTQVAAARAFVHRARPRLGEVRIGLVTYPGPDSRLALGDDPEAIDRALRNIAASDPPDPSDSTGFGIGLARALDQMSESERPGARRRVLIGTDGRHDLPFGPDARQSAKQRARVLELARTFDERAVALHLFSLGGLAAEPSPLVREITSGPRSRYTLVNEPTKTDEYLFASRMPYVTWVAVRNLTTGQQAEAVQYGSGGEFEAELPVAFGPNELVIEARSSDDERVELAHAFEFDGSLVRARLLEAERQRIERLRRERNLIVEPAGDAPGNLDDGAND